MKNTLFRHGRLCAAALLAWVCLLPVGAAAHGDVHQNQLVPPLVGAEDREAQNRVFPGHDGHIMPPTPQDWARYHAAEAQVIDSRPLFPYRLHQGGHKRRK